VAILAVTVQIRQQPFDKILALGELVPQIPLIGPRHFHPQLRQIVVQEIPQDLGFLVRQGELHTGLTSVTSAERARSHRSH
jgi:hypothetical protein